jgi:hypothetical protein
VTDSSKPRAPKSSRKKSAREPATLDLKATVVDDGARQESADEGAWDDVRPEETIAAASEPQAEDVVASPEATLDSALGTDSIGPEASSQEPPAQERFGQETSEQEPVGQEPPSQDMPPPAGPAQEAPARRPSSAALLGTGVLGGLVGAGLVYGVQTWMTPPSQDVQRITQLEQRVSAIGQQGSQPVNLQAVEERIRALETASASVDQRLQAVQSTAEQATARAEEALNRPLPEPPPPAPPQNEAALTELSERLGTLEGRVQAAAQTAESAASAVQALDGRVAEQDRRLNEQQQQRASQLEQSLAEQERRIADQGQRAADQEQRLAALSRQVTEEREGARTASQAGIRVILAERLGDALRNGAPYPEVLEGLRRGGAEQDRLAALEPFAQQGAPTAAELAQGFEPLAAAIQRESRGPADDWTNRLMRMADRVVTVRPVNEPGSTGVPSLVTRIEQALARGDVADAAAAWESLPEPSRQISEDWGRQVRAVAQAHQASQALAADSLTALNRTAQ